MLCVDGHNLGSETKRAAGIPLYMAIGQCGSILGSHIFPATEGPRYMYGFYHSFSDIDCLLSLTILNTVKDLRVSTIYLFIRALTKVHQPCPQSRLR